VMEVWTNSSAPLDWCGASKST